MGARHLMSGWADTSAVIARCFPARGEEVISTVAQRLTRAEEPQEGGGVIVQEVPLSRRCPGEQEHCGGEECFAPGRRWQRGKRKAHVSIALPGSRDLVTE